jgi:hypothetical protein
VDAAQRDIFPRLAVSNHHPQFVFYCKELLGNAGIQAEVSDSIEIWEAMKYVSALQSLNHGCLAL